MIDIDDLRLMMTTDSKEFAPYYRNGLLYLPPKTVVLLVEAGLDKTIGQAALHGLNLNDHRQQIAMISQALEMALAQLEEDSSEFRTLNAPDTQFMLTGKRARV
jgi:hypothetical protein